MKKNFLSIDYNKEGRGVKKGESTLFTFQNFFPLLKRKIWALVSVNFLWVVTCFPLLFGFFALSGRFDFPASAPADPLYAILSGVETFSGPSPFLSVLMGTAGIQLSMSYAGPVAKIFYAITALAIFTFGPANTGMAYMLRGYTKEEHVDMPSDFFRTIKKNFWQSILLGILDLFIIAMLIFDEVFFITNSADFLFSVFSFVCFFLFVIYMFARSYIYLMLVTFKLSTFKILKNGFIFAFLGIKRNLVGLLGVILVLAINIILYLSPVMPLGGVMPFLITIALTSFITTYAAWPNIKKIMIDPYYDTEEPDTTDDSIFTDRG